jgi:FkbM family methyltransferase
MAIEPDNRNFKLLEQNLQPYVERATFFHAGIWSHRTRLKVVQKEYGEWSTRVVECKDNEQGDLDALDIPTLLKTAGHNTIGVLKVDIEGAEKILFSRNYESWIDCVSIIAIELHGARSRKIFLESLDGRDFDLRTSGELMIAQRLTRG